MKAMMKYDESYVYYGGSLLFILFEGIYYIIILYSEASGESCLNDKKWRWLQLYAVGAGVANTDLFFFLLSSLLLHLDFAAGLFLYRSPRGIAWVYQRQTEANLVLSIMCFHCCDYIFTDI